MSSDSILIKCYPLFSIRPFTKHHFTCQTWTKSLFCKNSAGFNCSTYQFSHVSTEADKLNGSFAIYFMFHLLCSLEEQLHVLLFLQKNPG